MPHVARPDPLDPSALARDLAAGTDAVFFADRIDPHGIDSLMAWMADMGADSVAFAITDRSCAITHWVLLCSCCPRFEAAVPVSGADASRLVMLWGQHRRRGEVRLAGRWADLVTGGSHAEAS